MDRLFWVYLVCTFGSFVMISKPTAWMISTSSSQLGSMLLSVSLSL